LFFDYYYLHLLHNFFQTQCRKRHDDDRHDREDDQRQRNGRPVVLDPIVVIFIFDIVVGEIVSVVFGYLGDDVDGFPVRFVNAVIELLSDFFFDLADCGRLAVVIAVAVFFGRLYDLHV